jgi:7-carboxy-7-deazaguanine synthase
MIKINEMYPAIEGEGVWQGLLCYFIRFSGCNLECEFCDTDHKSCKEYHSQKIKNNVIEYFKDVNSIKRVVITGGEPFLQKEKLIELINFLLDVDKCYISIYTNGTIEIPLEIIRKSKVHIILDYKIKDASKMLEENLKNLTPKDIIKFVVDKTEQLPNIQRIIENYNSTFVITPSYQIINPMDIANKMIKLKIGDIKLGLQQHKYIYPPHMTGV